MSSTQAYHNQIIHLGPLRANNSEPNLLKPLHVIQKNDIVQFDTHLYKILQTMPKFPSAKLPPLHLPTGQRKRKSRSFTRISEREFGAYADVLKGLIPFENSHGDSSGAFAMVVGGANVKALWVLRSVVWNFQLEFDS
mmetsp:Transcript_29328/g.61730  ORF Transcript_29328/g.61730 Transcript_29328/m.61730 type:complete len:138 (+) Transcript_29328:175-588(+)